jgi:predicted TIM-barrel fold metal-dependent hydrolase
MNVLTRDAAEASTTSKLAIADGDIHPARKTNDEFDPWLAKKWRDHLAEYGTRGRQQWQSGPAYPKAQPNASRRDAVPPEGGRHGSSLSFMQFQHLDPNNVALGILNPLGCGQGAQNLDLCAAMCAATNEWQVAKWTSRDRRLKASIVVSYEDAPAAVAEIRKWAGHPDFAQVFMLSRTAEPLGAKKYWPIYEAAAEAGLPVGIHAFGYGGNPITAAGWPSYYIEEMVGHAQASQAGLASLVLEGVLARLPTLKLVLIEGGFGWLPALAWRLDRVWSRLRSELPALDRTPSDYIREQVWLTTQPMDEPDPIEHLRDTIGWIGWDKLIFATDYPHWDFDDPAHALGLRITREQREAFFVGNARRVWNVPA